MVSIELTQEHGKCIDILILIWIQQQLIFAIAVAVARKKSGIQPPTLYPRDSEIKALNLSTKEVDSYMCVQRMHQNNVEFLSCYFPMMIISMVNYPTETFYASTVVLAGRMVTGLGYYQGASKRVFGGWFHFGEYYVVYLAGKTAYNLLWKVKIYCTTSFGGKYREYWLQKVGGYVSDVIWQLLNMHLS